ncbi:MAG: segregation/condensation protein A [Devosiaceae bacterium]|nr:segregation/condensation protein A [Devosiaceae bacterium MH13]
MDTSPSTTADPQSATDLAGHPVALEEAFVVDIQGFEGPIDLLLAMARTQKVDLAHISIVALVDQYAEFIEEARAQRLELAADYLVMAAWLAYLKSRLLLPDPPEDDEPDPQAMADALARQLRRLDAVRQASDKLWRQPQLGTNLFATGAPQPLGVLGQPTHTAELYDLLEAYASIQGRRLNQRLTMARRDVWSLADARALVERSLGALAEWTPFDVVLAAQAALMERGTPGHKRRAGMRASAFAASLELVREGQALLRQDGPEGDLMLRAAKQGGSDEPGEGADDHNDRDAP